MFDDILERKQAFLDCIKRSLKRRKIGIFFLFLLGIIGQENVFYCILNRKKMLFYKERKLFPAIKTKS